MKNIGVAPGGPHVSSAKKRRLEALEKRVHASAPSTKRQAYDTPSASHQEGQGQQSQAKEETHAIYRPLPESITTIYGVNGSLASVLEDLMSTNPRTSDAKAITGGKLRDRTLMLDNPAAQREQGKRSGGGADLVGKLLSRKEQKRIGLYKIVDGAKNESGGGDRITYAMMLPIHNKWKEYINSIILPTKSLKELQDALYNAELHGCHLKVVKSPVERHMGIQGIVLKDSKFVFEILTEDDRVVRIPKQSYAFEYRIDARRRVRLLGDGLVEKYSTGSGGGKKKKKK